MSLLLTHSLIWVRFEKVFTCLCLLLILRFILWTLVVIHLTFSLVNGIYQRWYFCLNKKESTLNDLNKFQIFIKIDCGLILRKIFSLNQALSNNFQFPINGSLASFDFIELVNLWIFGNDGLMKSGRWGQCMAYISTFLNNELGTVYCRVLRRKMYLAALVKLILLNENYIIFVLTFQIRFISFIIQAIICMF